MIGLAIATVAAYCNATASAQLAATYPTSGGTYFYGRERLGQWWGFLAGWGFVIGKTASCAAMALTFAAWGAGPYTRSAADPLTPKPPLGISSISSPGGPSPAAAPRFDALSC